MTDVTKSEGFDLTSLLVVDAPKSTHKVPVLFNAKGEPTAGYVIVGKNSDEYRQVMREIRINSVVASARRQEKLDTTTEEGATLFIEAIDSNERRTALAITVGWYGFNMNGAEATFDKELVEKMFDKYPTWEEKVLLGLEKDANFM